MRVMRHLAAASRMTQAQISNVRSTKGFDGAVRSSSGLICLPDAGMQERGELLGLLTDQLQGLAAMRSALAGEARVAEVSAQWAAVLTERDRLLTEEPDVSSRDVVVAFCVTLTRVRDCWAPTGCYAAVPYVRPYAGVRIELKPCSAAMPLQSSETSTAVGSLAAAGGLAADLVAAQQVAEAAKKRLKLAEAALSGEVQRREVAERQLSSAQELLRR